MNIGKQATTEKPDTNMKSEQYALCFILDDSEPKVQSEPEYSYSYKKSVT